MGSKNVEGRAGVLNGKDRISVIQAICPTWQAKHLNFTKKRFCAKLKEI